MTAVHTKNDQSMREMFDQWSREKLIDYALSVTKAKLTEEDDYNTLLQQYESTQNWLQATTLVEEIGQHLSSTLDLNKVLTLLLQRVNDALQVEDGSILLLEPLTSDLIFQISLGSISEEIKPFRVPKGHGIAGEVALTGVPIRIDDAQKDSRHFKKIDSDTGFLTRSILCVPLVTREKVIGVIEVFNKKSGSFTESDELLLSSIANYAAIAIENARLHQSVLLEKDKVIKTQEEVSRKLQRDLHDGPTQIVSAIQMNIDFIKRAIDKDINIARSELDNVLELARKATHQMRTLLFELRPLVLETQGLIPALKTFMERREKDVKTKLSLKLETKNGENFTLPRFESKVEMALFAVVQEAVNNALKYAKADNIFVRFKRDGNQIELVILDDGLGFELSKVTNNYEDRGSYGMINMKERVDLTGGTLTLRSALGAGTEIKVSFNITPDILLKTDPA